MFDIFIAECGKVSKKLKQTILAFLAPPRVSIKARFMNLHRLVSWADRVMKHIPKDGTPADKLRRSPDALPSCGFFIRRFQRDAGRLLKLPVHPKNNVGLSTRTFEECEALMDEVPVSPSVRGGFETWMKKQLVVTETLGLADRGMPVCSDSVESLFGVAKHLGTGDVKDACRIVLRLPVFCGPTTDGDARGVLDVGVRQQRASHGRSHLPDRPKAQIMPDPGALEDFPERDKGQNSN